MAKAISNFPIRITLEDAFSVENLQRGERVIFSGVSLTFRYEGREADTYCFVGRIIDKDQLRLKGVSIHDGKIIEGYDYTTACTSELTKKYAGYRLQTGKYTSKHGTRRTIEGAI